MARDGHEPSPAFAASPALHSLHLTFEHSLLDTDLHTKSPEVQLQLSTSIHSSPPPPSPLHNALPPSPPSSNRASDALALANENGDFAQIFKPRNHSSLKRRRNIIASVSSSHAELVSILLDLPPVLNANVMRVIDAILQPTPVLINMKITDLLRIYYERGLEFFKAF